MTDRRRSEIVDEYRRKRERSIQSTLVLAASVGLLIGLLIGYAFGAV